MTDLNLRRFDLNLLVVFDALMRESHAGRAGAVLGLTQPAVSHALGRLRHELGDPLFIKHAKGMRPTPRAEALAGPLSAALRSLRAALADERGFDPRRERRAVRIGAGDYVDFTLMPPLVAKLRVEAPGFDIRLVSTARETVLHDLRRREIDLALGPMGAAPPGLTTTALFSEEFVLVGRQGHPALRRRPTPQAFAALPHLLVSPRGVAFGLVDGALRERGLERRIALTVPHFLAVPFIVSASDLVAVLPGRVARRFAPSTRISIRPLPIAVPPLTVGVARLPEDAADPALDWLVDAIVEVAARA